MPESAVFLQNTQQVSQVFCIAGGGPSPIAPSLWRSKHYSWSSCVFHPPSLGVLKWAIAGEWRRVLWSLVFSGNIHILGNSNTNAGQNLSGEPSSSRGPKGDPCIIHRHSLFSFTFIVENTITSLPSSGHHSHCCRDEDTEVTFVSTRKLWNKYINGTIAEMKFSLMAMKLFKTSIFVSMTTPFYKINTLK